MDHDYRKLIDACITTKALKEKDYSKLTSEIEVLQNKVVSLKKIHTLFKEASVLSQDFLSTYLETLVTDAIKVVFPDMNTQFKVEFVTTRDTQCILSLEEDGKKLSMFDSDGYGALDIVSIALHAAYIFLDGSERILVLDEPFRHLSVDRHELAAKMLHGLSHQLGIQIIINTHLLHIEDVADNIIQVSYDHKNKCSIVKGTKNYDTKMERENTNPQNVFPNSSDKGKANAKVKRKGLHLFKKA